MPGLVILVPVGTYVDPGCEEALRVLEKRGHTILRAHGASAIDAARNRMACDALHQGFDELMWIDSDIVFRPDDVERLRSLQLPFACGIYPKKNRQDFACRFLPGTDKVTFGKEGKVMELLYAGFGFVHTRRQLFETVQKRLELPLCNEKFGKPMVPYFMPSIVSDPPSRWYLSEDYAFCERCRQSGFKIMADTTIRLWHAGRQLFTWEDVKPNAPGG